MADGVIANVCECHCVKCERASLGLRWPQSEAAIQLKREGWRRIKGMWTCFACIEEIGREKARKHDPVGS